MDLVKIGFQINANGLKDANTEVDKLLDKVDNIGTKGKKASSDFEGSQKKVKDSTQQVSKEVDKTSKALEKQKIIGDYLGKGLDKTTATSIASFKQLGATVSQTNEYISKQLNNKGLEQTRKDLDKLSKEQQKQQEQQAKLVQDTITQYENLSRKSLGNGVLDQIEQQNKGLEELKKQYQDQEKEAKKKADAEQKILDDAEKARQKYFAAIQKDYEKQQQAIVDTQQKAIDKQVKAQNALNESNQKAIALEQAKAKYVSQGYGKTDSTRLARLEVSGADVTTLNNYKAAIEATTRATQALNPPIEKVTTNHSKFLDQVKGIAIYAALSAAIYGVMTAMTNLAVATVKMADEYTSIQNRMKLYIKDSQTLATVNRNLGKMAMENNVGLRETATLYTRLAPALQKLGGNAATVTAVVDAFGKSMRIGGATAQEAASATIQFSQAMASGKLAGDEFRSISEASPRFLKAIADGSGIATESLKKLSSEGFLTTSLVARALLREYPTLIEENKKLGVTLEQGGNAFKTAFIMAVGELNEGAKVTETIGNALLDVAKNLSEFAQTARQTGVEARASFEKYLPVIQAVGNVLEFVAIVAITKFAASMIVAGAISLKTAYNMNIAALGATALQRAFGVAAIAAIRLGSALTSLATPKNLATLALTVAGVAASYLLLRDNAAEATNKIVEQSEYVDLTTEAYKKLNAEQQKNAQASLTEDMGKINKELDSQAAAVNRVLLSYAQFKQMQANALNKETADVINQTVKGLISYDTAYRKLIELGVPKNVVEDFKKQKDVYDEAAKAGLKTEAAARAAGLGIKLSGNEAQNATPAVQGLKDGVDGLAATSLNAADSFAKMVEGFKTGVADIKTTLKVMQSYDLEKGISQQLIKESQALAKQHPAIVEANSAIQKGKEKEIAALGAKPSQKQLNAITERYDAIGKTVLKSQEALTETYIKQGSPYAQELQLWTDKESKFISDKNKQDKPPKKSDINNYPEQITFAQEYVKLLNQGVDLDVARIASQKEYMRFYKDNLAVATELANIQEMTRREENRQEYNKSLRDQVEQLSVIAGLTEAGADYETAKALAAAGFVNDAKGRAAAEKTIMNTLTGQSFALSDQITDQETLNRYLKEGMGLEEARFKVALSRIAKLSGGKNVFGTFGEDFENAMKLLREKRATEASQQKINSLNREADLLTTSMAFSYTTASLAAAKLAASTQGLLYSQAEIQLTKQNEVDLLTEQYETSLKISSLLSQDSEVMRDIKSQYPAILGVDAQRLETARKLLEITEAYSAKQQEQKKNPLGDFSNVDFEVFGDFGNPFKEALDGLNALVGGSGQLESNLALVAAKIEDLKTQSFVEDMFGNQSAVESLNSQVEKQVALEKDLQKQKAETIDIAYGQGLKFAKSFFKEESKGYKVVSALEMALQAKKIAFKLWEKKDTISMLATKVAGYAKDAIAFVTGTATKIGAQMGLNVAQAQGAVAASANAPPPFGFASAAAMIALMAGIGIAISGGSSSGSFAPTNEGTGTVFGDSEAQSASIANSIDLLSENSDLMLPLTSAMLRSLRNIESNIGGVTNLILRQATGGEGFNIQEGFNQNGFGSILQKSIEGTFKVLFLGDFLGIGKALGGLLGGLFGTKTTVKGQGLYGGSQDLGSILSQGFDLQEYVDIQTKKKAFGITTSTKNSTRYSAANKELENQFTLIFTGFYDSIVSASGALGANTDEVKKKLQDAVVSIGKIDLKGLNGEQIQEKLEAVFGAAADSLAQQGFAGLDDFQKVGEGYYETLIKVATGVEQAAYFTDRLNVTAINYTQILNKQGDVAAEIVRQSVLLTDKTKDIAGGFYELVNNFEGTAEELTDFVLTLRDLQDQLFMTGKNADYLTSSMILGAGGLDKLSSGFDAYFEMLSPAEQAAELTRRLTKEFAIFGKELPADVKAFRNLVSSIDITTEAGQKLYGQIIALAPEFNDLQDALDSANSDVNALVQSLRDLAEQARAARGETEQPRNLAYTRSQFEQASVLAMQGDIASAEKLLTLGKDLMGLSKTYSVTGSEYARDLALIQRAATVSADIQEQGLGTSISTTLTPSSGSTTTPTVNTNTTSTDAKLDALSEKLEAGLFAIAKYTQDSASRLERWDDGGRMMVGIQPENGDTPVPVVVTP